MFMASQIYVASVYGVKYCWFIMALDPVYQFSKKFGFNFNDDFMFSIYNFGFDSK